MIERKCKCVRKGRKGVFRRLRWEGEKKERVGDEQREGTGGQGESENKGKNRLIDPKSWHMQKEKKK